MLNDRTKSAKPGGGPVAATDLPDRKRAILLAAERLFAQHGYHAVSIRQIAEQAGVPLALVGYYYGPKHELFRAIFAHWNSTIEKRLARLAEARLAPRARRLPAIIRAFVEPVLELRASDEGESYALLVARELLYASPESDRILREYFDPLAHAFIDALNEVLPHACRSDVAWCYQFALGALIHHITDNRAPRLARNPQLCSSQLSASMLVNFIVGGMRATLPSPKGDQQPRRRPA
jgi:AcrR family transcriptional regulator